MNNNNNNNDDREARGESNNQLDQCRDDQMLRVSLRFASPIFRLSHSQESEMINYLLDFVEICKILWVYFNYGIGGKKAP